MIYFICEDNGVVQKMKIGYTGQSPESRCRELQTGNSIELDVDWYIPGDIEVERLCQEYFKEFHFRGEWYSANSGFDKKFKWCDALVPSIKKWLIHEKAAGASCEKST